MILLRASVIGLLSVLYVNADIYLHTMRGSNNRLNGNARDRRNANRLFDSQNNNRGGYNVGGQIYFANSKLLLEWTNQHTCGEKNSHCELVLQYMCHDKIRDGVTIKTIPERQSDCKNNDCNTDFYYGMQERYENYETCILTQRNKGLYSADQHLNRDRETARFTRQNPNGQRRGYECPEERDYYPYWRPSPWKDVVVMTNNITRCSHYKAESENVKGRFYCKPPPGYLDFLRKNIHKNRGALRGKYIPITKEECEKLKSPNSNETGVWTQAPSHGLPAPACIPSPPSRDNHNGNTFGGQHANYTWNIPNIEAKQCVIRMRYNISTGDYHPLETNARHNHIAGYGPDMYQHLGMKNRMQASDRGYVFKNDPKIQPIRELVDGQDVGKRLKLQVAVNTAQFGRCFQDRSHVFAITARPANVAPDATIINIGVRGKRGNNQQVYPAVEYDFTPNTVEVTVNKEYLHFQWTGSDHNPHNNNGQGRRGTDRSNVCLLGKGKNPEGNPDLPVPADQQFGKYGASYPESLVNSTNFLGLDDMDALTLCTLGYVSGDMEELDEAGTTYNHPKLLQCKLPGIWYYFCSRNNNFTNRSQKGKIICKAASTSSTG